MYTALYTLGPVHFIYHITGIVSIIKTLKKFFFVNFKAVKIHPISKGLAMPTNLSVTRTFEGCGLCDVNRVLCRDVYRKAFIPSTFKPILKLENNVNQVLSCW